MKKYVPNNLIIIKGDDKTYDVREVKYQKSIRKTRVTYRSGKYYDYSPANVDMYKLIDETVIDGNTVTVNGEVQLNVERIQNFGTYSRIVFPGNNYRTVLSSQITISENDAKSERIQDTFDYLKAIADAVGLIYRGRNILADNYARITKVLKESVLNDYLFGSTTNIGVRTDSDIVFPFGFNLSQKKAVENAISNKISVIEGPPGTGKTQTILNIIANAIINGESVAVVSNNNTAIKNVYDKLTGNDVGFIAAVLGNKENKLEFIEKQSVEIPQIKEWRFDISEKKTLLGQLQREERTLNDKLRAKNELSSLKVKRETLQTEFNYYKDLVDNNVHGEVIPFKQSLDSSKMLEFVAEYEDMVNHNANFGFFTKLKWRLKFGIKNYQFTSSPQVEVVDFCERRYYFKRLDELDNRIKLLEKELNSYDFNSKMQTYSELSMALFKTVLLSKYKKGTHNQLYDANDLWRESKKFIDDYPVILSTTYSLRSSLASDYVYDYVIIDEASQVDVATGALAFSCARKAVIVGDIKQLPNVVDTETRRETEKLSERYKVEERYRYEDNSLLSSAIKTFDNVPRVLLKEHYRCVPDIINFCNKRFYGDELLVFTEKNEKRKALSIYRTAPGNHARRRINRRQIEVIRDEVLPNIRLKDGETIGIVTPYRNQADELQKEFANTNITSDTVDKFQGQERTIMIFSTVDNEIGDFAADPNRLNVAVSRATDQFIVVTDGNDNDKSSPIHDLIGYIKYNNYEVIDSEIRSIFDNLYKCYSEARKKIIKKHGRVSEYDSENLMYSLIMDVLSEEGYTMYDVDMHIPLRHLIKDTGKLTAREKDFVTNPNSHIDFLLFSRLDYQPLLAIEVDGYKYHDANEIQINRDKIKDSVLEKYNIPIERFSTIGSGEKDKLKKAIEKIQ